LKFRQRTSGESLLVATTPAGTGNSADNTNMGSREGKISEWGPRPGKMAECGGYICNVWPEYREPILVRFSRASARQKKRSFFHFKM